MIPAPRAIGWTVLGVIVMLWPHTKLFDFTLSISIVALILLVTKSFQAGKFFVLTSLPFLLPLVIIHGLFNVQFPTDAKIWLVPYRSEGVNFALSIFCNLSVLLALAAAWSQASRDEVLEWMAARRIPVFALGVMVQSVAMASLIEKRGRSVLKAQMARGIRTGPNLVYRLSALPTVILPVVTSLINESDQRATALWSRGFLEYELIHAHFISGTRVASCRTPRRGRRGPRSWTTTADGGWSNKRSCSLPVVLNVKGLSVN